MSLPVSSSRAVVKAVRGLPVVDFVVIGGGITGLSAAFFLRRYVRKNGKEPKIVVLEGSKRLGGWIHSVRTEEGAVHELGPRTLRPAGCAGQTTINLACALGLYHEHKVVAVRRDHPSAKNRFIYANGKLHKLPNSLLSLIRKQEPFSKPLLSYAWNEFFVPKSPLEDESVYDFSHRRFGKEVTEYMVDAMCRGIYAGDARELSVRSCFPLLHKYEQQHGGIIKGGYQATQVRPEKDSFLAHDDLMQKEHREKWSVWTLKGGLQTLVEKLEWRLGIDRVVINTGETCSHLEFVDEEESEGGKKVAIVTAGGKKWQADHVVSCIPSHNLGQLMEEEHDQFAEILKSIKSVTVATVNLEYEGSVLTEEGFGYLVPSNQTSNVLGVVFDSCALPQLNRTGKGKTTRLTCMMGGAWFHDLFGDPQNVDSDHLLSIAKEAVRDHLGITATPVYSAVNIQRDCIPNYKVGHHKVLDDLDDYVREQSLPLTLLGSSYRGVSVNDCIYEAMKAVWRMRSS
ncbi:protoporphyrinogen oxidase-like [Amphiura filiformis]|uniref:protoporphyrinogen oxidase-like n=1 Tax=Amphiura filiformis TaxID=82378 RepID=UPI003B20FCB2